VCARKQSWIRNLSPSSSSRIGPDHQVNHPDALKHRGRVFLLGSDLEQAVADRSSQTM